MSLATQQGAKRLYKLLYGDKLQPVTAPDIRRPVTGATKPPVTRPQIIGIASDEELRERAALKKQAEAREGRKAPKHAKNYLGPRKVTCPCGTVFDVPRRYPADARKYCSDSCRKKYGGKQLRYAFTPEADEKIQTAYRDAVNMSRRPALRALSEELGIPTYAIRTRARNLGCPIVQLFLQGRRPSPWSEEEKRIVQENAALTLSIISIKLRQAGFSRSPTAIKIFISRQIGRKPKSAYSATCLAQRMGIDIHVVTRWIRQKLLRASAAGTVRKPQQGGDFFAIAPADVREFVINYTALIDFRKVDKFWLVELLTGKEIELVN